MQTTEKTTEKLSKKTPAISPATVTGVEPGSIAEEIGFEAGDRLVAVNGERPRDLIDYRFLCSDEFLTLDVLDAKGIAHSVDIEKEPDEELGLEFETALFDGLIQCVNRCPFCFIDQQPPGKRETLYLKDDDYRLSFLYGSGLPGSGYRHCMCRYMQQKGTCDRACSKTTGLRRYSTISPGFKSIGFKSTHRSLCAQASTMGLT